MIEIRLNDERAFYAETRQSPAKRAAEELKKSRLRHVTREFARLICKAQNV